MKKFMLLTVCLLMAFPLLAQQEQIDYDMVYNIKREGLQNSEVMDIAFYLTDVAGPRLTNSPGYTRAAEWAKGKFEEWGLKNAALEPWGEFGKGWENQKLYIAMTKPYYAPLIAAPKAWTPGTKGLVKGEVIFMDVEDEEDLHSYQGKVKGKIVLLKPSSEVETSFEADARRFTEEELAEMAKQPLSSRSSRYDPARLAQWRKQRALMEKVNAFLSVEGAALVLRGTRGREGTLFTSGGRGYRSNASPELPTIELQAEHALRMARLLEEGIEVAVEAEMKNVFFDKDLQSYNVVAEIPGTDPQLKDEIVMLGAHLDSWHSATGATDNAAGSAVMMEAIRILQAAGAQPRRTIRIALWSGEEQGLHGSRNYVKNHFGDPSTMEMKPEYDKFAGYFNIDNGTGRIRGIYLQGNDAVRPIFEQWFRPFDDMIDNRTITIRNTGGTDHLAFDQIGLPGFQFIQDPIAYSTRTHHTNMDTYERLQKEDLMQMACIVASFVYHTAMRDEKLPRKPIKTESSSSAQR
ncbi:MAG: M20/M25/M40 family metallo-hydrolase, partial [Bacteroidetes bacterium]